MTESHNEVPTEFKALVVFLDLFVIGVQSIGITLSS